MLGQLDLGEVSLPDGLEQAVLADVWLLAGAAGGQAGGGAAVAALERKEKEQTISISKIDALEFPTCRIGSHRVAIALFGVERTILGLR